MRSTVKPPSVITVSDVAGRDRTIKLAGIAGGADEHERLALELGGNRLGFGLVRKVVRFELGAAAIKHFPVVFGCPKRLFLRQQIVARVAVLDVDDVAHLAKAADTLKKNNLHGGELLLKQMK